MHYAGTARNQPPQRTPAQDNTPSNEIGGEAKGTTPLVALAINKYYVTRRDISDNLCLNGDNELD